jgi:hypothetical protein
MRPAVLVAFRKRIASAPTRQLAEIFFNDDLGPIKRMALILDAGHFAAFMQPDQFLCEPLVNVHQLAEGATLAQLDEPAGECQE